MALTITSRKLLPVRRDGQIGTESVSYSTSGAGGGGGGGGTGTTVHNDLTGLQGGTTDPYYHLTSAEYTGTGTGVFV